MNRPRIANDQNTVWFLRLGGAISNPAAKQRISVRYLERVSKTPPERNPEAGEIEERAIGAE
jgi:hypothetical protein